MTLRLAVLGLPGAGKGTQAGKLAEAYDIPHISMGDILRNNKEYETEDGRTVGEIIDAGNVAPIDAVITLLAQRVDQPDCANGFVLDGFPRTEEQAERMDEVIDVDAVLLIEVDEANILERLTGRRICPDCGANYHIKYDPPAEDEVCDECGAELVQREDDTEERIRERISWQQDGLEDVLAYFEQDDTPPVETIDGNRPIPDVWASVQDVAEQYADH